MNITQEMKTQIERKETLTHKLNRLLRETNSLEIKERTKRVALMNELAKGEKITEKAKVAKCDEALRNEMNQLSNLKLDIGEVKREIELCNDKISLCRNMIRELEITL